MFVLSLFKGFEYSFFINQKRSFNIQKEFNFFNTFSVLQNINNLLKTRVKIISFKNCINELGNRGLVNSVYLVIKIAALALVGLLIIKTLPRILSSLLVLGQAIYIIKKTFSKHTSLETSLNKEPCLCETPTTETQKKPESQSTINLVITDTRKKPAATSNLTLESPKPTTNETTNWSEEFLNQTDIHDPKIVKVEQDPNSTTCTLEQEYNATEKAKTRMESILRQILQQNQKVLARL